MTTNQQNREEWEKKFDVLLDNYYCASIDNNHSGNPEYEKIGIEINKFIRSTRQSAAEEGYKKGFIDGSDSTGEQAEEIHAIALDKAKKEAREEVIKAIKIERIRPKSNSDYDIGFSMGWNTAEDTIRNEIQQLTTK